MRRATSSSFSRRQGRLGRGGAAALAMLAGAAVAPGSAAAFARMTTPDGEPLAWPSSCAYFTLDAAGSDDVEIGLLASVVVGAFNAWGSVPEAYLTFQYNGLQANTQAGWFGGGVDENVIRFVESDWANVADPDNARPSGTIALTTVSFDRSGAIIGADMELNGEDFTFTTSSIPGFVIIDVANTLTHEAGHFIGIHHNCFEPGSGLEQNEAPNCDSDIALPEATMFWEADPGELKKRSLEPDDTLAVATVYALAADPGRCEPPGFVPDGDGDGRCNCRVVGAEPGSSQPPPWGSGLVLVIGLGLVLGNRARRAGSGRGRLR